MKNLGFVVWSALGRLLGARPILSYSLRKVLDLDFGAGQLKSRFKSAFTKHNHTHGIHLCVRRPSGCSLGHMVPQTVAIKAVVQIVAGRDDFEMDIISLTSVYLRA
ncbi:hypothetical protein BOTBODRAFT_459373 [Botryobasidium botryosum FD-172 SS1]|uniref:Uncharacterized protein n=1 Tax=Botryobasidium botryosum (strain FD-172 SS1) TaxID=930990 RepID=A0A067MHN2_BOTB1|nr:hypothetical protein BOTBODRAFT_459373 [Botryobasidium botryosum FD-172 SS1]